jgi:hypothetical protein
VFCASQDIIHAWHYEGYEQNTAMAVIKCTSQPFSNILAITRKFSDKNHYHIDDINPERNPISRELTELLDKK